MIRLLLGASACLLLVLINPPSLVSGKLDASASECRARGREQLEFHLALKIAACLMC
jgi:hypothetical protein